MKHFKFKQDYQIQAVTATQSTDERSGESSMKGSSSPIELYVPQGAPAIEDENSKIKESGYVDVILSRSGLGIRAVSMDLLEEVSAASLVQV